MTDEIRSAITSDKVETDNTNFATVRADQTVEEVLIPRENAFRQLTWQVTLEKGAVYNPPEQVGIYAEEVDCGYGVQVNGDVFGRKGITVEHGGAAHDASDEADTLGTRIVGSLVSEGQIDVRAPEAELEDWSDRPVSIYGDVTGGHVTFNRPTVVYGSVRAEQTFRTNAPTVVLGSVDSGGMVEASDLFAFSITAHDDVTLGGNVAVANPTVRSETGNVHIADEVGILVPELFETISADNDVDAVGPWIFDVGAVWENSLVQADVTDHDGGQTADRAWRTVEEFDADHYADVRRLFREMLDATRNDPPDVGELRYAGVASIDDLGGDTTVEGDVVVGKQEKTVEDTDVTKIDNSTTEIDESTEIHDESTTVEDSVVNRSDIGSDEDSEE